MRDAEMSKKYHRELQIFTVEWMQLLVHIVTDTETNDRQQLDTPY